MRKSLGDRLRELRGAESQTSFCAKIQQKQGTYSAWERDEKDPSSSAIALICKATGISSDWLLGLSPHTVTANNSAVAIHNSTAHNGCGASETKALEIVASQQETISRLTAIIENLTLKESRP